MRRETESVQPGVCFACGRWTCEHVDEAIDELRSSLAVANLRRTANDRLIGRLQCALSAIAEAYRCYVEDDDLAGEVLARIGSVIEDNEGGADAA